MFASLRGRLLDRVHAHVRNGCATERGLARAIAASQPHVHNILAGKRGLSIETADALLCELRIGVYDLLELREVLELEERRGGPLSVRRCCGCR
jgi:plasmid maintenance system antidote protein VapI